jgi:hypothetical protein
MAGELLAYGKLGRSQVAHPFRFEVAGDLVDDFLMAQP